MRQRLIVAKDTDKARAASSLGNVETVSSFSTAFADVTNEELKSRLVTALAAL